MSRSLSEEISLFHSHFLDDLGFRKVEEMYDVESFGDSTVILESDKLQVRFIRDRGQVFADISSSLDPTSWWDLALVAELTGTTIESEKSTQSSCSLVQLVSFITRNYQTIVRLFTEDDFLRTRQELERLEKQRMGRMFNK